MSHPEQRAPAPSQQPLQFAAVLALFMLLPGALAWLLQQLGVGAEATAAQRDVIGMAIVGFGGIAVLAFSRWSPPAVPWRPLRAGAVLAVYLPFALGWAVLLVGYLHGMHALGHTVAPQPQLEYLATARIAEPRLWLLCLGTVLLAPLVEELVFRGYLLAALLLLLPKWGALLLTAAVFGYVHGPGYAVPIGVLGLLFGWLRLRHGSLLPSMLAHAVHNGIVVAVTFCWPHSLELLYPR